MANRNGRPSQNFAITNRPEVRQALSAIPDALKNRVMAKAVDKALAPVVKAARSNAPKRSGLLKKSMRKKVKKYPSGVVFGAAGPDRDTIGTYNGKKAWPNKYAHLVERGTQGHEQPKLHKFTKGAKPAWYLREAWYATKQAVVGIFTATVQTELEKEVNKRGK